MPFFTSPKHAFSTAAAEQFGPKEALIIQNLEYWLSLNFKKNKGFKEGKVWSYQTYKDISKNIPYLSPSQVRRLIKKLIAQGVIVVKNFNKKRFDKTNWYTFAEKYYNMFVEKMTEKKKKIVKKISDGKKRFLDKLRDFKRENKKILKSDEIVTSSDEIVTPIPDTIKEDTSKKEKKEKKAALSDPSPTALELSSFFYESLKKNVLPKLDKPNMKQWGRDIDAILKTYTPEEVRNIIIFSTTSTSWWVGSIVDSRGLKKHFNRLVGDMSKELKKAQPKTQEVDIDTIAQRKLVSNKIINENWTKFRGTFRPRTTHDYIEFGIEKLYYKDDKFPSLFEHYMKKHTGS